MDWPVVENNLFVLKRLQHNCPALTDVLYSGHWCKFYSFPLHNWCIDAFMKSVFYEGNRRAWTYINGEGMRSREAKADTKIINLRSFMSTQNFKFVVLFPRLMVRLWLKMNNRHRGIKLLPNFLLKEIETQRVRPELFLCQVPIVLRPCIVQNSRWKITLTLAIEGPLIHLTVRKWQK